MAYLIGGGGASLPTSTTGSFDVLVPDLSGGWQKFNRKIGYTDYNADEWTVVETIDPTSTATVTQTGNTLVLQIESPSSATSQYLDIKKVIEAPNFVVFGHIKTSANNVGYHFGGKPFAGDTQTRDLFYQAASTATGVNVATKRNASESYPSLGTTTKTTGNWVAFSKSGDAMGMSVNGTLSTSESPQLTLEDFTNFTRTNINYNTTSYQYRAGTTGQYDSLTQKYVITINLSTPAATGTYSVTVSYLEQFLL